LKLIEDQVDRLEAKMNQQDSEAGHHRDQLVVAMNMCSELETTLEGKADATRLQGLDKRISSITDALGTKMEQTQLTRLQHLIESDQQVLTDTVTSLNTDVAAAHDTLDAHEVHLAKLTRKLDLLAEPHVHDMPIIQAGEAIAPELTRQFDASLSTLQRQLSRKADTEGIEALVQQAVARQGILLRGSAETHTCDSRRTGGSPSRGGLRRCSQDIDNLRVSYYTQHSELDYLSRLVDQQGRRIRDLELSLTQGARSPISRYNATGTRSSSDAVASPAHRRNVDSSARPSLASPSLQSQRIEMGSSRGQSYQYRDRNHSQYDHNVSRDQDQHQTLSQQKSPSALGLARPSTTATTTTTTSPNRKARAREIVRNGSNAVVSAVVLSPTRYRPSSAGDLGANLTASGIGVSADVEARTRARYSKFEYGSTASFQCHDKSCLSVSN
jgi:hypothetical protein